MIVLLTKKRSRYEQNRSWKSTIIAIPERPRVIPGTHPVILNLIQDPLHFFVCHATIELFMYAMMAQNASGDAELNSA